MREDVIGRANVEDTPELAAYYDQLGAQESYALWTIANSIEPWHPQPTSQPTLWSYRAMRPLVLRALDLVSPEKAGRRVIALENPGRRGLSACVGWLYSGLQVMRPGEFATAHNHASAALRFVIEGAGAYTVVDGHKMDLAAGDFVITPNGTWHDHGVESDGAVTVWQDGLDMLLVNQLDANFYAVHPDFRQKSNYPLNDTTAVYGGPGLLPMGGEAWSKPYSPLFKYEWGPTYDALQRAAQASAPRRIATRARWSTTSRRAQGFRSSPVGATTGRRMTFSWCRRGRTTNTPTSRTATTPCCSRSATCRRCTRSGFIVRRPSATTEAISRLRTDEAPEPPP